MFPRASAYERSHGPLESAPCTAVSLFAGADWGLAIKHSAISIPSAPSEFASCRACSAGGNELNTFIPVLLIHDAAMAVDENRCCTNGAAGELSLRRKYRSNWISAGLGEARKPHEPVGNDSETLLLSRRAGRNRASTRASSLMSLGHERTLSVAWTDALNSRVAN